MNNFENPMQCNTIHILYLGSLLLFFLLLLIAGDGGGRALVQGTSGFSCCSPGRVRRRRLATQQRAVQVSLTGHVQLGA